MDFPEKVDDYCLTLCSRFSHWLQRTTGWTNFFVAKIGFCMFCISQFLGIANYWWPLIMFKTNILTLIFYFCGASYATRLIYYCDENERRLYQAKLLYKIEGNIRIIRLFFLGCSIIVLVCLPVVLPRMHIWEAVYSCFYIWGFCIGKFFIAVTPLPPGTSKIRQFINDFVASFKKPVSVSN